MQDDADVNGQQHPLMRYRRGCLRVAVFYLGLAFALWWKRPHFLADWLSALRGAPLATVGYTTLACTALLGFGALAAWGATLIREMWDGSSW